MLWVYSLFLLKVINLDLRQLWLSGLWLTSIDISTIFLRKILSLDFWDTIPLLCCIPLEFMERCSSSKTSLKETLEVWRIIRSILSDWSKPSLLEECFISIVICSLPAKNTPKVCRFRRKNRVKRSVKQFQIVQKSNLKGIDDYMVSLLILNIRTI